MIKKKKKLLLSVLFSNAMRLAGQGKLLTSMDDKKL